MSNAYNENIDPKVVEEFQDVIIEILQVLHSFGIEEMHVGGLMRLLGVSTEVAELYDEHVLVASDLEDTTESDFDLEDISPFNIINNTNNKIH